LCPAFYMSKGKIAGFVILAVVAAIVALIIFSIATRDPFIETMEGACYPDLVKTFRKEPGPRLFVTCMKPDGTITKEVEVKRKP
jgi:hypothetical protein